MEGRAVLLTAVLAATMLAGCAGAGGPAADPDAPSEEVVEAAPGVFVAVNRGAVRGVVVADTGLPVPTPRVSLTDGSVSIEAGKDGTFLLQNVTPGTRTLRVEKTGFHVLEQDVAVSAGNLTQVNLTLVPDASVGAGYRPHVHDYWGTASTVLIMDDDAPMERPGRLGGATVLTSTVLGTSPGYEIPWHLPAQIPGQQGVPSGNPALIYPGTVELRITYDWDPQDVHVTKLGLRYATAATSDRRTIEPVPRGTTMVIPVPPEATDAGHQVYSMWEFLVYTGDDVRNGATYEPGFILGPIHIKVEVVKGDVPVEPEHADFWANGPQRAVRTAGTPYTFTHAASESDRVASGTGMMRPDNGAIVPPGTTRLRMDFSWSSARTPPPGDDWVLTWRTGAQDPHATEAADFERAPPVSGDAATRTKTYEIEVDGSEADAFYQRKSLWRFMPSRAGDEDRVEPYYDNSALGYSFQLAVTAFRDA